MQVGSLIECIKPIGRDQQEQDIIGVHIGDINTVSGFGYGGGILLYEVPMPIVLPRGFTGFSFDPSYFREVQPPMSISVDEIIKEPEPQTA